MKNFNALDTKNKIVAWIKDWFNENGSNCNAIIGLSGGKDSAIVAALCVEALGNDRVIGVTIPNTTQTSKNTLDKDMLDVEKLVKELNITLITIPIASAYSDIIDNIGKALKTDVTEQTKINLSPRLRMATLYAVSQSLNGRVANTCNLSEEYVGYSTRWGDNVGDFAPIADFTVTELLEIGKTLNISYDLISKIPADGLCGKTDEDNLGFKYSDLDKYIRTGICDDDNVKKLIDEKHSKNLFKLKKIPKFNF